MLGGVDAGFSGIHDPVGQNFHDPLRVPGVALFPDRAEFLWEIRHLQRHPR